MNNITNFFTQRTLQLEQEVEIDQRMLTLGCHQEVISALLFLRRVNRRQTHELSQIPSYNIPALWSHLHSNLEEIDTYQKSLLNVLSADNPCHHLKLFIDKHRMKTDKLQ